MSINPKSVQKCVIECKNVYYNIASRAKQSNSVYVSVPKISIVLADGVSKSLRQKYFFARAANAGKILSFATLMDTETRPTGP